MRPYGHTKGRQRWICPSVTGRDGLLPHEPCTNPGFHTLSLLPEHAPRFVPAFHRGSPRYRAAYARRTAIERAVNKPAVADSGLQHASRVQAQGRHLFDLFIECLLGYARAFIRWASRPSSGT